MSTPSKKPKIADRLEELKAKAKRAGELHRLLEELRDADPYKDGRRVEFIQDEGDDHPDSDYSFSIVMNDDLLRKVIDIGVETLRKRTEDELTALLG